MGKIKYVLIFLLLAMSVSARETIFSIQQELRIDLVSVSPSPLVPGGSADLLFEVQNLKDTPLTDNKFSLTPVFPLTVENPSVSIPVLNSRETKQLLFKVNADPSAADGIYKATLEYEVKELQLSSTATVNVTVRSSQNLVSTQISTFPERVEPGKEMEIQLKIKNTADADLKDVSVKLDFLNGSAPFVPLGSGAEQVIKSLRVGEEKVLSFDVLASPSANIDVYRVPLVITSSDLLGKSSVRTDVVGLTVDATPEYSFNVEQRSVYSSKDHGKVSVALSNIGVSQMKFVTIILQDSPEYNILSKKVVYLGNLESDDSNTADFDVEVLGKEEVPLKFTINYKDVYNKDYSKEEVLPLKLYSSSEAKRLGLKAGSNGGLLAVVLIALVLVGFIIYRRRKKMTIL